MSRTPCGLTRPSNDVVLAMMMAPLINKHCQSSTAGGHNSAHAQTYTRQFSTEQVFNNKQTALSIIKTGIIESTTWAT
jgi:hypothetical protein